MIELFSLEVVWAMEEAMTSSSLGSERENGVLPPHVGASLLLHMAVSFFEFRPKDFLLG